ncbi:Phospholipid-transporting ATPase IK [Bagarius yarrelli]|uniref:Phospholipid-transporting ATPase n=1 Tax=Bagarius yarrelli TaxID=175774 RepID=A0A556VCC2_BAGYA|nr:Phospholipid-transporting ATPase IK [Bagarius yarrelli]
MGKTEEQLTEWRKSMTWKVQAKCCLSLEPLKNKKSLDFHRKHYADNLVRSYKYTPLTFLPRNLYEQFQRAANFFFLIVVIMQCIPAISTISWYVFMLPLLTVLTIRGAKDDRPGEEDGCIREIIIGRRRSDARINKRSCDILTTQGETNLKFRQALTITHNELAGGPVEELLQVFDGVVCCEAPNNHLYSFRGELHWQGQSYPLDNGHILLRETVVRNTDMAYGLVIYTGADSKILRNCGTSKIKKTRVEKFLNKVVGLIVISMLIIALLLAVGCGIFEHSVSSNIEVLSAIGGNFSAAYWGFLTFWGYIVLLSPAMPIALYITFELIHVVQCFLIGWDIKMYWEKSNSPAQAKTKCLTEELGQVGHLLTDKTGTLTQNHLLFRQCCIGGQIYGDLAQNSKPLDLSWNCFSCGGLPFSDQRLVDRLRGQSCSESREFFTALALCHTVMCEWRDGFPHYQAASPDENALVCAARELGWVFLSRTRDSLLLSELGITRQYILLALLEFTSKRRRMSVLVRTPEGAIKLYCKGADAVVLERTQKGTPYEDSTKQSLEVFAQSCLRTLCVAVRSVGETQWVEWSSVLRQGAMATNCQESMLEELHDQIERELTILGVAAIEDRLQEGVPETIISLRQAGVKVWVLTGDKTELYFNKSKVSKVWSTHTVSQWSKAAIVVDGFELEELIKTPELGARFVSLCNLCQSVLCCRVTPGQKAKIVDLVKMFASSITLAIGDGANDVNMIKTAHIGVGIHGVEDGQAVQNADFALAQFCFLRRLLLVHGQWSYRRICSFLNYFLYKTTSFALVNIWFSLFNGFSAQLMYESWFISFYSVLYTSLPVQCLGLFEQNMSAESCLHWPELYMVGQKQELFNPLTVCVTLLYSVYTSAMHFFLPFGVFQDSDVDYQTLSVTVGMSAVFSVTVEIILHTKYWTKYNVAAVFVSLMLFFLSTIILHSPRLFTLSPKDYSFFGASLNAFTNPVVWLATLLTSCTAVLPSITCRALSVIMVNPNKHKIHSKKEPVELQSWIRNDSPHHRFSLES